MEEITNHQNSGELGETSKAEVEVHLAEYEALSEFQRDAKATFVRVAMYHNTGILLVTTWVLQQASTAGGISVLRESGYVLPLLFSLPVVNAVLIVACAYQVYSFFCVARHFQLLRARLTTLVGHDVLAYEDKFRRATGETKELSLVLDVMAAAMWFVIPIVLAATVAFGAPVWLRCPDSFCKWAYWTGTTLSVGALTYLLAVVVLMIRTRNQALPT